MCSGCLIVGVAKKIAALDGYVARSGTPTQQEEQSSKKLETAITPAMLPTTKIIDHLMSVEGGCQTEEVAKANATHMINILNMVANEEAKKKHQKPPPTLPPKKRDGPGDEEDADLDGGVVEPPPAKLRQVQVGGSEGSDKRDETKEDKEPTKEIEPKKSD